MTPLALEGVGKRVAGRRVLQALSLSVRAGEFLLIRGDRGAGRTTLARLLAGQTLPDEGVVRRGGVVAPLVGASWGFRGGAPVSAGLRLRAAAYDVDPRRFAAAVAAALPDPAAIRRPFSRVAGAERTALLFASAYAVPAALYVIDGPPLPADPALRARLRPMFEAARGRGAVVWIAESGTRAEAYRPDRTLVLGGGGLRDGPAPDGPGLEPPAPGSSAPD